MLVQEKGCLPSFQPYPHTHHAKQKQKCYTNSQNLLCANSKAVQGSEASVGNTQIRKTAFLDMFPKASLSSLHGCLWLWSECDLLASLPIALQKRGAQAHSNHLVI